MSVPYKELYAALVGQVDDAVTILDRMVEQRTCDWFHAAQVSEMLKAALLEAEERYLEADDGPKLIVLPPGDSNFQP